MSLTLQQKKRYSRHLALPLIGQAGQEILTDSSVLIVGAGGLGCPLAMYLAAAGIGHIGIIDHDVVELSNLQRQIAYKETDIGKRKVEILKEYISATNPEVKITIYPERLTQQNIHMIGSGYEIIADASDNFATRYLVNHYCVKQGKILVWAAISEFMGQISTVKPLSKTQDRGGCFQCFCPQDPGCTGLPVCANQGILGSMAGIIGTMQATEIIKEILSIGQSLVGFLLQYDGLHHLLRKTKLPLNDSCPVCHTCLQNLDKG